MEKFNETERQAILQCLWQLLRAKPSQEESDFITELTTDWQLGRGGWMYQAIQLDPYKAFNCVAGMNTSKKEKFKEIVVKIVEYKGDNDFKTKMAATLFDKTNVLYAITARDTLIYDGNNKGMYKIL